jgi:hypothetical protein
MSSSTASLRLGHDVAACVTHGVGPVAVGVLDHERLIGVRGRRNNATTPESCHRRRRGYRDVAADEERGGLAEVGIGGGDPRALSLLRLLLRGAISMSQIWTNMDEYSV